MECLPEAAVWGLLGGEGMTDRIITDRNLMDDRPAVQSSSGRNIIELKGIIKRFYIGQPNELEILHGIDLSVKEGEFVSIVGASGSGKTTLMNIIGVLDRPTEGEYILDGVDVAKAKDRELSGGQKQRVSIARAMTNNPSIILADEPTGALDSKTGRRIMDIFHRLNQEEGKTIVLITHSNELAEETQRIVTLKDGEIIGERKGSAVC